MKKSRLRRALFLLGNHRASKSAFTHLKHKFEKRQPKLIPEIGLEEIVPPEVSASIIDSPNAELDGNVAPHELRAICRIIKHFKPASLFEIGTFEGHTTVNMAANAPGQSRIFTLGLPASAINHTALRIKQSDSTFILKQTPGREFLARDEERKKITQLLGDSARFDYTPYNGQMDFVFVDGSHSYEYARSDTETALKLLRNGEGIILWHDYGWREVVRALNELYLGDPRLNNLRHIRETSIVIFNSNTKPAPAA